MSEEGPTLFEIDCKAHETYCNAISYYQKWHPNDIAKIQVAKDRHAAFCQGMIDFHGQRAIQWLEENKND